MRSKITILLVEDRMAEVHLFKTLLHGISTRYEIIEAQSLAEAIGVLNGQNLPDCILLDLNLGDSQGLKTFEAVQLCNRAIPILIYSGIYDQALAQEAIKAGAIWYVLKGRTTREALDLHIQNAILAKQLENQKEERLRTLDKAREVAAQQLQGLAQHLVACASCRRIKDESLPVDSGEDELARWFALDIYLSNHGVELTHTICPACRPEIVLDAIKP